MLRKQKLCLSKLLGAPVEFIEHGYIPKHLVQLECGHSMCEGCAVNGGPRIVTCGTCGTRTQLKSIASADLPRNSNTLAQSTTTSSPSPSYDQVHTCMQAPNFCSFVDQISRLCDGCYKRLATLTCHICDRFLCDSCWPKVHFEGSWLSHVPLSVNAAKLKTFGRCKIHRTKLVESYCEDCRQYICPDCVHRKHTGLDHDVISVLTKNNQMLDRIKEVQREVEENMKRMEDTIEEVAALKETTEKTTCSDFSKEIIEKFINCHGMLQSPEETLRQKVKRQEANKRIDLDNILTQLYEQIQVIQVLFSDIRAISECENLLNKVSVEEFFPMLMDMKYAPCMLDQASNNREDKLTFEESGMTSNEEVVHDAQTSVVTNLLKSSIQLINIRGQTNSDLGHETDSERRSKERNAIVSKGQIVSGTPGKPRGRSRSHMNHYSSLNLMRIPAARTHSLITEGCSYGVHLSHVKDPGEFYVVRTTARKQQQRIERLAPTLVDRCGHAPRKLQKDELYLVECVLDRKWYRGRVIEVLTRRTPKEESSVLIFNLDYGNTQVVPHSRLRVMPDLLQAEPAMALRCRLSECIPANGKWCRQAAKMMIDMMKEGIVTMYVVRVLPDILEVDLSHKSDECSIFDGDVISLRDSMVFMEYSLLITHPHANALKKSVTARYPQFLMPKVNSTFTGIITHVVSSTNMYMQKICIDTDYLMDLMGRINTFYDMQNQKGYIYNPVIGMPCVAICTQDYLWYRAKIIDLPGHERITVQYVDYGNEDILSYKLVRKLKPEFRRLPPQAFLCTLEDMIDPQDPNWRLDAKTYMQRMSEEVFQVKVISAENYALAVELQLDPCCFRSARIQPSFTLFGKKPSRPFFRIRPSILAGLNFDTDLLPDSSDRGKAAKLTELYNNAIKSEEYQQISEELTKGPENVSPPPEEIDEKIGKDLGIRIKILKVTSPSEIFVSVQSFLPRMQELDRELQDFYMFNVAKKNTPWISGDYCAILSYNHGKWLRGYVDEVTGNDMFMVQYFDTMGKEEVPVSSLRILDPHFLSYPIGFVKCHLDGVARPGMEWPEHINEFLISELQKHEKIYMTKRGKIKDYPSLPIKLWVKIKDQTEAVATAEAETKLEPEAVSKAEAETEIEPEAVSKAEAETELEPEAVAEAEAETQIEPEAVAEAEAEAETELQPEAVSKAEAETKLEPEAVSKAEAETELEPEAVAEAEAEAETELQPEAVSKAEAETELEPEAVAEAEAETEIEPEAVSKAEAETELEPEAVAEAEAETEIEPEAVAEAEAEAETELQPEAVSKAEAETKLEPEAVSKAEAETELEPEAVAEAEAETEMEPEAVAEAEAETEIEPEAVAEAEAETEIEPEAVPKAEAETEIEPEAVSKAEAETEIEPEAVSKAEAETELEPEAVSKAEAETEIEPEAVAKAEAKAESVDESSSEKWVALNDLIEEQQLEISGKEKNLGDSVEITEGAVKESQGSSNEDKGKYTLDENDFKLTIGTVSDLCANNDANGNKDRICEWVEQKNSSIKYFLGEPTHVDSDGCIYLHDIERDGAVLELLQYSLYQFYKDTTPEPSDPWAVNDICVAKYYIDNCWYRGRILEINDGFYKVFFVDFGHAENCPSTWLRRCTMFIETPTLAQKFELYGVFPLTDSGKWPSEVIDKIYEIIIEKKCNVTVVEREPGTTPKIYLRVCENDQDLAEYLVTLGMATFGSEMNFVLEDSNNIPKNFFEERFQDVEIFPVAPVTQAYNSGYRPLDIPTVSFPFPIKITMVKEYHICANIVDDEAIYPRLRRNIASLQRLTDQMQILGDQQPLLNNVQPGVACLGLYGTTGTWHRAEIEGVDPRKDLILLHYVDYGYTEYVTRDRIRTILPRWFDIPRMALNFKLYRLKKNPEIRRKRYLTELNQALLHTDLMVRIMQKCKDYYEVEIRRKNSTELVYQKLIDDGLLLPLEEDEIDYFDGFEFEDDDEEEDDERAEGRQSSDDNQEAEEREGPDEHEGSEECNGPAECEESEYCDGSDEFEGSEDMEASDDDEEEEEEEEDIDFEVEEIEEEEEEGEEVEEEEEEEEEAEGEEEEEAEGEEEEVVQEEYIEVEVD